MPAVGGTWGHRNIHVFLPKVNTGAAILQNSLAGLSYNKFSPTL